MSDLTSVKDPNEMVSKEFLTSRSGTDTKDESKHANGIHETSELIQLQKLPDSLAEFEQNENSSRCPVEEKSKHCEKGHEFLENNKLNNPSQIEENDQSSNVQCNAEQNNKYESDMDPDTICGIGCFKPQWLQPWATPRVFLVLYCFVGVLTGMYYTYRIGVITTLEKRFTFKSKTSGMIMMVDEIVSGTLGTFVGYFGGITHRPRVFGASLLMSSMSCFISSLPFFIYGPGTHLDLLDEHNKTTSEICDASDHHTCDVDDRPPTVAVVGMLMVAGFLTAVGSLAYHSVGLSYMDDGAKKKNTPLYLGIAFSSRLVGPALGFLMASFFLGIPENPIEGPKYETKDPRWIGAWWMGFLLQSFVILMITIPISLFPKRLPGHKAITNTPKESTSKFPIAGLIAALKRLGKNPFFIVINVNAMLQVYSGAGHFLMLPKYLENQFRLSASDANFYSGPFAVGSVMLSTVCGSLLIWRFKPRVRVQIGLMILLELFSAVGYLLLMIPRCESVQMQKFGTDDSGLLLHGSCNMNCNCSTKVFTPVCGSDGKTAFFSPCLAGCTQSYNNTFLNCSCASDLEDGDNSFVTEGYCINDGCWGQAIIYIVSLPIFQFVANLLRVQYTVILMRSIDPQDKSIALGMFDAVTCIFGLGVFLMFFGAVIDSTCLIWEKSCEGTGNCWFYDLDRFRTYLHVFSAGFSVISALSLVLAFYFSKSVGDLYQEDMEEAAGNTEEQTQVKK